MTNDPTGYASVIAEIPANQLSSRQQRIAAALAMIREGSSCSEAARVCDIPRSTLSGYEKHITKLGSKEADGMGLALEELQRGVTTAALIATERVTERLVDPEHEWRDGDLIKAQGVNVDKVLALRQQPQSQNTGISALEALLNSADVTITKRDASKDAIDVTATDID